MKKRASVALIIETSSAHGRRMLHGVARYMHVYANWSVFLDERGRTTHPPSWLADWEGDGIICRSTTPDLARALSKRDLPTVDCNERYGFLGLPYIVSDTRAVGAMATRHLLERGFKRIGYCGFENETWSKKRMEGVKNALDENAASADANGINASDEVAYLCGDFESPIDPRGRNAVEERERLCEWIESLEFPVGIVACNDMRGQHVLDACHTVGVAVPEQVAVVGVDNSEILCSLCEPALSSVVPAAEKLGFESAALLDRLMKAKARNAAPKDAPVEQIYLPPVEVVTRQSSDIRAVNDPAIARALQFIRERATDTITVDEVAAHVRMSRSTLERNFRRYIGCSPQQEIRRVRLLRVQSLLRETDLPLARIAELTGYDYPQYMMSQFKKAFGQTPSQWREAQPSRDLKSDN